MRYIERSAVAESVNAQKLFCELGAKNKVNFPFSRIIGLQQREGLNSPAKNIISSDHMILVRNVLLGPINVYKLVKIIITFMIITELMGKIYRFTLMTENNTFQPSITQDFRVDITARRRNAVGSKILVSD